MDISGEGGDAAQNQKESLLVCVKVGAFQRITPCLLMLNLRFHIWMGND